MLFIKESFFNNVLSQGNGGQLRGKNIFWSMFNYVFTDFYEL